MIPTPELRARLRKLLNEVIPGDGTEKDTNFTDDELDQLLTEADSIFAAASVGWTMKAGMLQAEIESYKMGDEQYDVTSLKDKLTHALMMADRYKNMASAGQSGFMLRIKPPEVV